LTTYSSKNSILAEIFLYRCTIAQIAYLQTMRKTREEKRRPGKVPAAAVRRQTASSSGSGVVGAAGGRALAGGGLGASGVTKGGDPGGAAGHRKLNKLNNAFLA
jgi:hypothetical protein